MLPNPAHIGSALSDLIGGGGRRRERPDFRQGFHLALAKVLGAAAWIDAPINQPEVNVIKSLLNELSPRLTSRELQSVQRYLAEPVPGDHWDELLLALSGFTRRRARRQFALQRLQSLLASDGEPTEVEKRLFAQARSALDWRGSQPDTPEPDVGGAASPAPDCGAGEDDGGIRLGDLARGGVRDGPPPLVDRVREAAAARMGGPADDRVPRRLAVWCAAVVHVTVHRARTDGEDAELVGFLAAVGGVDEATAETVLAQAREAGPAAAALPELAAELRGAATAVEVASLAQLLNAMAGGDAALRRLEEVSRGMEGIAW
ncbi:MAG: hypothetical protein OXH96_13420 [Spirochaetaceae bacterium]|nr:hypothetical protein [Spirochaetaceae bacterium]